MARPSPFRMLSVLFSMALLVVGPAGAAPRVGEPAPDFRGLDSMGEAWSLADLRGKVVVLEWTNHECPYVRKHYSTGNMQELQKDALDKGFVWLSVISSAPGKQGHVTAAAANLLTTERNAFPKAVLLDETGEIGRAYSASTTPHMFIISGDGVLRYMGGIDDRPTSNPAHVETAQNHVRAAMDDIAAGRGVARAITRPYGCSVKYK